MRWLRRALASLGLAGAVSWGSVPAPAGAQEGAAAAGPNPSGLSEEELSKRREALGAWTHEPVAIEGRAFLFHLDRRDGSFFFQDRRTGVKWLSAWGRRGFASVRLKAGGEAREGAEPPPWLPLDRVEALGSSEKKMRFRARSSRGDAPPVRIDIEEMQGGAGVSLRFEVAEDRVPARVEAVRLLDGGLWIPDAEPGGIALPRGLGEWLASDGPGEERIRLGHGPGAEPPTASFLALAKSENVCLLRWLDPLAAVEVERRRVGGDAFPGRDALAVTVEIRGASGKVELVALGKEELGVVDAARAYRQLLGAALAESSLRLKTGLRPELRALVGAAIFRPDVSRSPGLDGVGRLAERLRRDLEVDEAAFVLGGWKDADPAALAACGRRVKEQGYVFGLEHAVAGGGDAPPDWKALLEEGRRPGGFPALLERCAPQLILLREAPPGALAADADRTAFLAYLRETFGLVAVAGGSEADVQHAAVLEGLLDGVVERPVSARAWPVFTAVFGQFARITTSPGRALRPDDPAGLLAHLVVGEVPVYELPAPGPEASRPAPEDDPRWCFARGEGGWAAGKGLSAHEVFLKNTFEVLSHVARIRFREPFLFHRVLAPDGSVRETFFGPDLRILVNFGPGEYEDPEDGVRLPAFGFFVRHPFLRAFHATRAGDVEYERSAFFALRSLEGKMILRAESVRIYHGFGPKHLELGGRRFEVEREAVVRF
ncbi:MAG: hypothetical protein HY721_29225 [Planctomycetes bacterium]|nr:hypothetical protein [Planctomycetota bacterium]